MALEDLLGSIYQTNMGLPLQYALPWYQFQGQQSGNMAGLGGQYVGGMAGLGNTAISNAGALGQGAMGLYGNLANTQAGMYQSELPIQLEAQKYNSLAPALAGLLNQFGGVGGGMNISPISMQYNRPDVMAGYQGAVNNSYNQLGEFTQNAYNQTQGAYGQAQGALGGVGNQVNQEYRDLTKRVFGGGQPPGPQVAAGGLGGQAPMAGGRAAAATQPYQFPPPYNPAGRSPTGGDYGDTQYRGSPQQGGIEYPWQRPQAPAPTPGATPAPRPQMRSPNAQDEAWVNNFMKREPGRNRQDLMNGLLQQPSSPADTNPFSANDRAASAAKAAQINAQAVNARKRVYG